jgi:adenylate cyclase
LWGYYHLRSEWQIARELAEQLLTLAEYQQDTALILQGHRALGDTLYWLGEFELAYAHLEQGIALYDPHQHHSHVFRYGQDPGAGCLVFSALTLWHLGYSEQALRRSNEALTLTQDLSHPFSRAHTLSLTIHLHIRRREWSVVQQHAEAVIALSTEQGFAQWLAVGTYFRGLALVAQGDVTGMVVMRQGITARRSTGSAVRPVHLILFVEALKTVGQNEEAFKLLAEAKTIADKTGESFYEAELYRLKGELLLQQSPDNATEAETCFQQAISTAQSQSAKSWELRAATSLARLWQQQDKRQDAYDILASVYSWFTEGFDTANLIEAKALLDELSEGR